MRQDTICTGKCSLHMLSERQCQWLASVVSGFSICPTQVLQASMLVSRLSLFSGGRLYTTESMRVAAQFAFGIAAVF